MTIQELYHQIKERFLALPGVEELLDLPVLATADPNPEMTLMPAGDVPSPAKRPEFRVTVLLGSCSTDEPAENAGMSRGEAYTETPASFTGTLREILELPVSETGIDARFIAAINASMSRLGLCDGTFPDDPEAHFRYAEMVADTVFRHCEGQKLILVGYDGYLVKTFMDRGFDFWTMDRDPDNITKNRFNHVIVNSGRYNREACFAWGRLFLVTGSALCNGTIVHYLDQGRDLYLYGITGSGVAKLLDLPLI